MYLDYSNIFKLINQTIDKKNEKKEKPTLFLHFSEGRHHFYGDGREFICGEVLGIEMQTVLSAIFEEF